VFFFAVRTGVGTPRRFLVHINLHSQKPVIIALRADDTEQAVSLPSAQHEFTKHHPSASQFLFDRVWLASLQEKWASVVLLTHQIALSSA
jgi:hypothetical protein